jgi:non-homologous end joining protein Ku
MPLPKEMLSIAEHIVDIKLEDFDPAYFEYRYRTVLVSMLKEKSATMPPRAKTAAPSQKNVIDLMAMLKQSLGRAAGSWEGPQAATSGRRRLRTGDAKRSKRVQE